MNAAIHSLYTLANAADRRWMDEIRKAFPNQRAGDVRYTKEALGTPDSTLRAAYDEYKQTRDAWLSAVDARRAADRAIEKAMNR